MVKPPKAELPERDEFLDAVGHRIKIARVEAKLTQKDLGKMIGAPQSWIYLAEDGQQNLQISSLRRIAHALGVSVRDLIPEGPDAGPEYDAAVETNETFETSIRQLTDVIGMLHRLQALTDKRKGPGRRTTPSPRLKKDA